VLWFKGRVGAAVVKRSLVVWWVV